MGKRAAVAFAGLALLASGAGAVTQFDALGDPFAIVSGPGGALWFIQRAGERRFGTWGARRLRCCATHQSSLDHRSRCRDNSSSQEEFKDLFYQSGTYRARTTVF